MMKPILVKKVDAPARYAKPKPAAVKPKPVFAVKPQSHVSNPWLEFDRLFKKGGDQ